MRNTWMETPYNADSGYSIHQPPPYYVQWLLIEGGEDGEPLLHGCATLAAAKRLAGTVLGQVYRLVNLRQEGESRDGFPLWQWDREETLVD